MGIGVMELLIIVAVLAFLGLLVGGGIVVMVLIVKQTAERKGDWGINAATTHCPRCQAKLPALRRPKNLRQALWGGWTCSQCGQELDKWGRERL